MDDYLHLALDRYRREAAVRRIACPEPPPRARRRPGAPWRPRSPGVGWRWPRRPRAGQADAAG